MQQKGDVMKGCGWPYRAYGIALLMFLLVGGLAANADQIRLKDGKEIEGMILQKDGESVILRLPRASVEAVNGKALPPPVTVGAMAPDFNAVDLSGAPQSMVGYRGNVTLLQFWATWCPHCRSDVPFMKEVQAQYKDKGLKILTVSIDQKLDDLQQFLVKEQLSYPVISALSKPELPDLYESQGVPGYFLIDAKGRIANLWRGSLSEGSAAGKTELHDALAKLFEADQPAASMKPAVASPNAATQPSTPERKSRASSKRSKNS